MGKGCIGFPGLVLGPGWCIWNLERVRSWHYSRCFVPCFRLITSIWFLHNFLISMRAIRVLPGMAVRPGKGVCQTPSIHHFSPKSNILLQGA